MWHNLILDKHLLTVIQSTKIACGYRDIQACQSCNFASFLSLFNDMMSQLMGF